MSLKGKASEAKDGFNERYLSSRSLPLKTTVYLQSCPKHCSVMVQGGLHVSVVFWKYKLTLICVHIPSFSLTHILNFFLFHSDCHIEQVVASVALGVTVRWLHPQSHYLLKSKATLKRLKESSFGDNLTQHNMAFIFF